MRYLKRREEGGRMEEGGRRRKETSWEEEKDKVGCCIDVSPSLHLLLPSPDCE